MSRASQAWKTGPCAPVPHALRTQPLSRKELVVLRLLAEGHSNTAMAQKLIVSDSTVRSHLRKIYSKLDVHSRTQAILHSRQQGLLA
jgi:LuxR family transcriptional regulator, maltose regulon positive regulatory protein